MKNFKQKYMNAKTAIKQIRAGEWQPHFNSISGKCLHATRGDLELWIGNGAWFCDIKEGHKRYFGLLFRHWVWWAAARRFADDADALMRKEIDETPVLW